MRRFYLNAALPASQLAAVRERLTVLQIDKHYTAEERFGLVAVTAAGGALFETLGEAEAARKVLRRAARDLFDRMAVAFVETGTDQLEPAGTPAELESLPPLRENKLVVSVEDDPVISRLIEYTLRALGVELVLVHSGREALHVIEDLEPDLAIIDLMLPDMHGWELVEKMKANEVLREVRVIIMTALNSEADRVFGLSVAGVDDFLVKPVSMQDLRRRVWAALSR